MVLPLEPTDVPGVYRRGSKFVVVYRAAGRQHTQAAETMADARAIKLQRDGEARARRRGPTLHEFTLSWLDRYGHLIDGDLGPALDLRKNCERPSDDRGSAPARLSDAPPARGLGAYG
jgi:hypothetical protein